MAETCEQITPNTMVSCAQFSAQITARACLIRRKQEGLYQSTKDAMFGHCSPQCVMGVAIEKALEGVEIEPVKRRKSVRWEYKTRHNLGEGKVKVVEPKKEDPLNEAIIPHKYTCPTHGPHAGTAIGNRHSTNCPVCVREKATAGIVRHNARVKQFAESLSSACDGSSPIVSLDFSAFPELLEKLRASATDEMRTAPAQAMWIVKRKLMEL